LNRTPRETSEPFDLRDSIAAALDAPVIHDLRAARPDVMLEVNRGSSPILAKGDPATLRATLTTLLAAMIRALPSGGQISIELREEDHVEPWGHLVRGASGTYGVICLHTSVRLSDEELDHCFEPYAVNSIVSGDGLALTRLLLCMRTHRGLSLVRTTPSPAGTELRLLFPIAEAPISSPAVDGRPETATAHPPRRVLVVDDSPHHRREAVELLQSLNCESEEAASSAAALAKIGENCSRNTPYDLVLVDLVLGEPTDGVDLLRQIVELGNQCPVALMGGFADLGRITEGRRAGALAYLRKPLALDALEHVLAAAARARATSNANPGG